MIIIKKDETFWWDDETNAECINTVIQLWANGHIPEEFPEWQKTSNKHLVLAAHFVKGIRANAECRRDWLTSVGWEWGKFYVNWLGQRSKKMFMKPPSLCETIGPHWAEMLPCSGLLLHLLWDTGRSAGMRRAAVRLPSSAVTVGSGWQVVGGFGGSGLRGQCTAQGFRGLRFQPELCL